MRCLICATRDAGNNESLQYSSTLARRMVMKSQSHGSGKSGSPPFIPTVPENAKAKSFASHDSCGCQAFPSLTSFCAARDAYKPVFQIKNGWKIPVSVSKHFMFKTNEAEHQYLTCSKRCGQDNLIMFVMNIKDGFKTVFKPMCV